MAEEQVNITPKRPKNGRMTDSQFNLAPSWQTTATIISMVLENPDARMTSKDDARKELMRMAALLDKLIQERGED
tara:strand:+ start:876 stop:1100 length:225 start_codon:yes stop_codon:yes gene_type:complete